MRFDGAGWQYLRHLFCLQKRMLSILMSLILQFQAQAIELDGYDIYGMHRFVSRDAYNQIIKEGARAHFRGDVLTIDTWDKAACRLVAEKLSQLKRFDPQFLESVCNGNGDRYVNLFRVESIRQDQFERRPILTEKTHAVGAMGVGIIAAFSLLPPGGGGWESRPFIDDDDPLATWRNNIGAGPVFDHDPWVVNLVAHPYSGATYYMAARNSGVGAAGAFGYSVMMSTFYWEFGLEAFAEPPSIQDLIITPVLGALLGEQMYRINNRIKENGGLLFGSKTIGQIGLILTDPVGALQNGLERMGKTNFIHDPYLKWQLMPFEINDDIVRTAVGFQFGFSFGRKR